jgi:hypothetical protein
LAKGTSRIVISDIFRSQVEHKFNRVIALLMQFLLPVVFLPAFLNGRLIIVDYVISFE